mmetsp:Transcript_62630/g.130175  ORF Transcript_62630/g.130175 Transcript_62630/m.130175 type:complete len:241 (+) Transcript_62630:592-1314(+)
MTLPMYSSDASFSLSQAPRNGLTASNSLRAFCRSCGFLNISQRVNTMLCAVVSAPASRRMDISAVLVFSSGYGDRSRCPIADGHFWISSSERFEEYISIIRPASLIKSSAPCILTEGPQNLNLRSGLESLAMTSMRAESLQLMISLAASRSGISLRSTKNIDAHNMRMTCTLTKCVKFKEVLLSCRFFTILSTSFCSASSCLYRLFREKAGASPFRAHAQPCTGPSPFVIFETMFGMPNV